MLSNSLCANIAKSGWYVAEWLQRLNLKGDGIVLKSIVHNIPSKNECKKELV
jgi:hypothetical protein